MYVDYIVKAKGERQWWKHGWFRFICISFVALTIIGVTLSLTYKFVIHSSKKANTVTNTTTPSTTIISTTLSTSATTTSSTTTTTVTTTSIITTTTTTRNSSQRYIPNIPIDATWAQNGVTVVGGHYGGKRLNEIAFSEGLFIDDDGTIYVADTDNDRIVEWKSGATTGKVVAGGHGKGDQSNQLQVPRNVIIDKENDCFIISDYGNRRVVRWPYQNGINVNDIMGNFGERAMVQDKNGSTRAVQWPGPTGEIIISNIDGWGLALDDDGYFYVADKKSDVVKRWKMGDINGTVAAGGNGDGYALNQFESPTNIFVDQDGSLYVSDKENNRVMKWTKDAKEGIIVAGGHSQGDSLTQLCLPSGIIVDQLGTIYVVDQGNSRVMRWLKGASAGNIVVGGNGVGKNPDQFNVPTELSFDRQNNLYVVDANNSRVQKFIIKSYS